MRVSAPFRVGADSQEFPVARAVPRSVAKAPFPIFTETKPDHARGKASQPKPKKKRHNWSAAEEEKLKLAIEKLGSSRIADITRSLEGERTKEQVKSKIRTMVLKQQRSGH
ncbi:MAG: SANT/Myb-like DNA-binding domain-containing protein [archaeon]|nr:SANT/Myb-like DNA-binding domain-containing protein [archaeon]